MQLNHATADLPPFMRPLATEPPDPTQQPDYDPEAGIRRMGFVVEAARERHNTFTKGSAPQASVHLYRPSLLSRTGMHVKPRKF
jgi:hypothetical protein